MGVSVWNGLLGDGGIELERIRSRRWTCHRLLVVFNVPVGSVT